MITSGQVEDLFIQSLGRNKMEAFNTIEKLKSEANRIKMLFLESIPAWTADPKHYDKVGFGFNLDDRFQAATSINVYFSSKCGIYGNSSCYSVLHLDDTIWKNHFIKYLNKNKTEIMLAIADQMLEEAKSHKTKAMEELETNIKKLQDLE